MARTHAVDDAGYWRRFAVNAGLSRRYHTLENPKRLNEWSAACYLSAEVGEIHMAVAMRGLGWNELEGALLERIRSDSWARYLEAAKVPR